MFDWFFCEKSDVIMILIKNKNNKIGVEMYCVIILII